MPETCETNEVGDRPVRQKQRAAYGNLARPQELEKSLERSESRRLHAHTTSTLVDRVHQVGKIRHDLLAKLVLIVVLTENQQTGSSDGLLEIGSDNLNTERSLDLLVMDVLALRATKGSESARAEAM